MGPGGSRIGVTGACCTFSSFPGWICCQGSPCASKFPGTGQSGPISTVGAFLRAKGQKSPDVKETSCLLCSCIGCSAVVLAPLHWRRLGLGCPSATEGYNLGQDVQYHEQWLLGEFLFQVICSVEPQEQDSRIPSSLDDRSTWASAVWTPLSTLKPIPLSTLFPSP